MVPDVLNADIATPSIPCRPTLCPVRKRFAFGVLGLSTVTKGDFQSFLIPKAPAHPVNCFHVSGDDEKTISMPSLSPGILDSAMERHLSVVFSFQSL